VYRRRRLVVGTVLAVAVISGGLAISEVLAGDGGVTASASAAEPVPARVTVTARPGDTLWAIAQEHRGEVDVRRYLDRLIALNGGASIQAGQAIVLP
jgi:LysM repeat protein